MSAQGLHFPQEFPIGVPSLSLRSNFGKVAPLDQTSTAKVMIFKVFAQGLNFSQEFLICAPGLSLRSHFGKVAPLRQASTAKV